MKRHFLQLIPVLAACASMAQVPDPVPAPAPAPAAASPAPASQTATSPSGDGGSNKGDGGFLGGDAPFLDPGSEIVSWNGKSWNVSDNRIFEARFEKYLNNPEDTSTESQEYQGVIQQIMDKLAAAAANPSSVDDAFRLLARAAQYDADAHLCDTIANQVYSSWMAIRANGRVQTANTTLEKEKERLEWNQKMAAVSNPLDQPSTSGSPAAVAQNQKNEEARRDTEMAPITARLAEVNGLIKANQFKVEVGEVQAKMDFQALIVQMFTQRRFQHVLICTRFYREIFNDGDSQLRVGEDAKSLFEQTSGMPPTVNTVDSLADEAMHDVREGAQAFQYLVHTGELDSATKRLEENFLVGEYMPEIRSIPRDQKREALSVLQKSNQLVSALQVKDYTMADRLCTELQKLASDIDLSKATAQIETSRTIAAMHIAKAKNAAVAGDRVTLETELKAATEIWPRNPDLAEVSNMIFTQGDVQSRALVDFDQLLSEKNYRQIYDDRMRFIAATAMSPARQEQLRKVLENMSTIETAIMRSQAIEQQGDYAGAWETAESAFQQFPEDNKLNQVRADLTTKAAGFVHDLERAKELEAQSQPGSSLAWYLKAQNQYPSSSFAKEGIERLTRQILPDAT